MAGRIARYRRRSESGNDTGRAQHAVCAKLSGDLSADRDHSIDHASQKPPAERGRLDGCQHRKFTGRPTPQDLDDHTSAQHEFRQDRRRER